MAQEGSTLEKFVFTWQSVCIVFFLDASLLLSPTLMILHTKMTTKIYSFPYENHKHSRKRRNWNRNLLSPFSKVTNGYCFFRIIIFLYNKRTWNLQTSHLGYRFFLRGIFFFSQAAFSSRLTIISSSRAFFLLLIIVSKVINSLDDIVNLIIMDRARASITSSEHRVPGSLVTKLVISHDGPILKRKNTGMTSQMIDFCRFPLNKKIHR